MSKNKREENQTKNRMFGQNYPHITEWVQTHGWIEMGQIDSLSPFILALDEGGVVWEGKASYATIDDALNALEKGLANCMEEQGL